MGSTYYNRYVLSALFLVLMLNVARIDEAYTQQNVYDSEVMLAEEGQYPEVIKNFKLSKKDNFTDAMMVGMCALPDSSSLYVKSLHCTSLWTNRETQAGAFVEYYKGNFSNQRDGMGHYSRYWLGFQSVLKPLLTKFNLREIRCINYLALSVLLLMAVWLIAKRLSWKIAYIFMFSMLVVLFPMVPVSLQFSTCFYIMLTATVILLSMPKSALSDNFIYVSCFVIGGFTAFLDFLTTPTLTIGIPLALVLLYSGGTNTTRVCVYMQSYVGRWGMPVFGLKSGFLPLYLLKITP